MESPEEPTGGGGASAAAATSTAANVKALVEESDRLRAELAALRGRSKELDRRVRELHVLIDAELADHPRPSGEDG